VYNLDKTDVDYRWQYIGSRSIYVVWVRYQPVEKNGGQPRRGETAKTREDRRSLK